MIVYGVPLKVKEGQAVRRGPGARRVGSSRDSARSSSVEETTRALAEASISGTVDHLRGLKENVTSWSETWSTPSNRTRRLRRELARESSEFEI